MTDFVKAAQEALDAMAEAVNVTSATGAMDQTRKLLAAQDALRAAIESQRVHPTLSSVYEISSALSWNGFSVCGTPHSIAEVNRLVQRVASLEEYLKSIEAAHH